MPILGVVSSGANVASGAFESIASISGTVSGTLTFSNIPQTYKHLQFRILARSNKNNIGAVTTLTYAPNGNTLTQAHNLIGNGSTASSTANNGVFVPTYDAASDVMAVGIIDVHDYTNTTTNKTIRSIIGWTTLDNASGTNERIHVSSGFYDNTSAITSFSLSLNDGEWETYSYVALYGIKGA